MTDQPADPRIATEAGPRDDVAGPGRDLGAERREGELLEHLVEAIREISSSHGGEEAFEGLARVLRDALGAEHVAILGLDVEEGLEDSVTASTTDLAVPRWPRDSAYQRLAAGQSVLVMDTEGHETWQALRGQVPIAVGSALHVPLGVSDGVSVLLCTHPERLRFGPSHLRLAQAFVPSVVQARRWLLSEQARARLTELTERHDRAEEALTLVEHAMESVGGALGILEGPGGKLVASEALERMLVEWASPDEWCHVMRARIELPSVTTCPECGGDSMRGSRVVTVESPRGPRTYRITFVGHNHRREGTSGEVLLVQDRSGAPAGSADDDALRWSGDENPAPVLCVAPDGTVLSMNRAARHASGRPDGIVDDKGSLAPSLAKAVRRVSDLKAHREVVLEGERVWNFTLVPVSEVDEVHLYGRDISAERRAAQDLERTSSRLSALVSSLQAGVLVEDQARRVALVNPEFLRMFGAETTPEELVGADCAAIAEGAKQAFVDPAAFISRIEEVLREGVAVQADELHLVDGRVLERDFVPIEVGGRRGGYMWQYRDVTAARSQEALHRAITGTALDAIVTIDHHGAVLDFNPAAEQIFGRERSSVLGRPMAEIIMPERYREAHAAGLARYVAGGGARVVGQRIEIWAMRADGSEFPIELAINQIPGSNPPVFTAFIRDITLAKERQEELSAAKEAAEDASRAKSEFLAVMSHEVRTPMNAILGMTELSMDRATDPDQAGLLRTVQSNAELLLGVINDILDFSKIEAGHLAVRNVPFDPAAAVETVVEAMAVRAFGKGLELTCRLDPRLPSRVLGDEQRVQQILVNLVGNAVKFTDSGEVSVWVGMEDTSGEDARLRFKVTDTGMGIEPEELAHIFEPFFQADSSLSRPHGGSGLGLGICRSLLDLMGGAISATSTPGVGSEFTFEVPAPHTEVPEEREATTPGPRHPDAPLRAIVASPNESVSAATLDALSWLGIETKACPLPSISGGEFDTYVPPTVLFIDLAYGGPAIREGLARVGKGHEQPPRLVVIAPPGATTALDSEAYPITYLRKPVTRTRLRAIFERETQTSPGGAPGTSAVPAPGGGERILLVEDNRDNRAFAERVLSGAGYRVTLAESGTLGLAAALDSDFDLIVTDLEMPDLDGFRMTERIFAERGRGTPIMAFTAHAIEGYRERCLQAGMVGYLAKPVRPAELIEGVRSVLARPPKVLVVDDAPESVELVRRFLGDESLVLDTVASGELALQVLSRSAYDAILLDMNMRGMSGYETASAIREGALHADRPIIAMTSWSGAEVEERCLASGCTHFLGKPLTRALLVEQLREALPRRKRKAIEDDGRAEDRKGPGGTHPTVEVDPAIADLVPEYLESRRSDAATMTGLLRDHDFEPLRVLAHNLVGSGVPFGFSLLSELGRTIEKAAVDGDTVAAGEGLRLLDDYLADVTWRVADDA